MRLGPVLAVLAGCGPVQSSTLIVEAAAELAAAQTAQADEHAPFEIVAAEEYLHKAREEQSYADYEVAVDYARKSRDCSRVARTLSEAATREGLGTSRPTPTTKAKCRPGPERLIPIPDPAEEARAIKTKVTPPKKDGAPEAPTDPKTAPKAAPPPPPATKKPVVPAEPEDPPLPEGDAE